MNYLLEFLHQEVPKSGKSMPLYYRKSLFTSEIILAVYFLASTVIIGVMTGRWEWFPVVVFFGSILCLLNIDKMTAQLNLVFFSAIVGSWVIWYIYMFGWSSGSQHVLLPVLALSFFNIYLRPTGKVLYFIGLVILRIGLFAFSLHHTPDISLSSETTLILQILNSTTPLLILANNYILFSSSVQATERQLTINNQELHKEAGTDPLTGLPNRRALLDVIDNYRKDKPSSQFSVAIADIDFFKRVNDTYGHNCGDYTLKTLAELFMEKAESKYTVCRWGGEEFCFFLPEQNLDEAGIIMHDLHTAVGKMPLHYEDIDYKITITIGVEENDFQSTMEDLFNRADRKLYMGKANGRDQVVI